MAEPAWTHPVTGEEFAELTDRERTMLDVIESLDRAVDRLEDVGVRREQTLREYEESESVRLARWLDASEGRAVLVWLVSGGWKAILYERDESPSIWDQRAVGKSKDQPTRDAALSAALDQAEGVQDGRG